MEEQNFGWALNKMREGIPVSRRGWNGKEMCILIQQPDENSKMTLPYIYMCTVSHDLVPWLASQTDLLSYDWVEA